MKEVVLSELPEEWQWTKLGDVVTKIIGGGTPSKDKKHYWNGDIPWLTVKDMRSRRPADAMDHISEKAVKESSTNIIPEDTVIIATRIGLGKVIRVPYKAAINQDLKALILPPEIEKGYLEYWFVSKTNYLESIGSGTTVKGIRLEQVRDLDFPLAPPEKQKRIVAKIEELFSHIDAGIDALKKAKQLLKQYRQSVLKAAVTGELTKEWREANKAKLEQFKVKGKMPKDDKWKEKYKEPEGAAVDDLPEIPNEWVWATLPQLGELNRGKSKHRPRNDPSLYGGDYSFVQTGDVRAANTWLKEYSQTYSEKGLAQSRLWPKGTMCITIAANIADTAILEFDACFPDSVVGFIPLNDSVNVEVVEFFIRTVKSDLEKYAPATAQKNINLEILGTVAIPLLPVDEQRELLNSLKYKMSMADRLEEEIDHQLIKTEKNKQSILSFAFSGNISG